MRRRGDRRVPWAALLERGWALLVFAESDETLAPLESVEGRLRALGVRLLGIGVDRTGALETYARRAVKGM